MAESCNIKDLRTQLICVPFGPLDLVVYNTVLMSNNSLQFQHKHDYFEIHLVVEGDSVFELDEENVSMTQGQLIWINPGVLRSVRATTQTAIKHFVVHFDLTESREINKYNVAEMETLRMALSSIYQKKCWVCFDKNQCGELFERICREMELRQFGYLIKVSYLLASFILSTIQSIGIQGRLSASPSVSGHSNTAYSVVSYIRNHYNENITLASTAKALNLSPRHITRMLRETHDSTFKSVLVSTRVELVKNYLGDVHYSQEQITELVGFASVRVMQNNFKKATGMTVGQYRKQMKGTNKQAIDLTSKK